MPFHPFDSPPPVPSFDFFPALFLCRGEAVNGDAVFPETGRADGRFLFLIIDVAGHGPTAAAIVDEVRLMLQDSACHDQQPADLLQILNGMLQQTFAATMRFVAALAILIDGTGAVIASNAGQPAPWVGQPGGNWQQWAVPGRTFLGVAQPDEAYAEGPVVLAPGQNLLAFTDGVTEAGRWRKDLFAGRIPDFLSSLPAGLSAGQVVVRLLQALQVHAGADYPVTASSGAIWPEDDTTVIGLSRR
jgi:serine phosphatase RsbU (regulator of sigma subunit)